MQKKSGWSPPGTFERYHGQYRFPLNRPHPDPHPLLPRERQQGPRPTPDPGDLGRLRGAWPLDDGEFGAPGSESESFAAIESRPTRMDHLVAAIKGELNPDEPAADLAVTCDAVAILEAICRSPWSGPREPAIA